MSPAKDVDITGFLCYCIRRIWHQPCKHDYKLEQAVHNLISKAGLDLSLIIISLLYFSRTVKHKLKSSGFSIFLANLIIAQKLHSDHVIGNSSWAGFTGYALEDINYWELEILSTGSKKSINQDEFNQWTEYIKSLAKEYRS
ncbi:hypothetical protein HDV06_003575 [Boothiomyces sp. JEL0866]|nr:hypothetical protein HDV06_003575 [Boothiomyces sp. JEL0866]